MGYLLNILIDNLLSLVLGAIVGFIIANWRNIWTSIKALLRYNREVRISISYLYRIKINDKYLLISGNKIDQFQPIGGVYKCYDSFKSIMEDLGARPEDTGKFYEKGDLRLIVKGKKIDRFIHWFYTNKNREISVYREFVEEIINDYDFPISTLADVEIEFIKRIAPKITYSQHFQIDEMMIYDIYELRLKEKHELQIKDIVEKSENLVLVSGNDIGRGCLEHNKKSKQIGKHAKFVL